MPSSHLILCRPLLLLPPPHPPEEARRRSAIWGSWPAQSVTTLSLQTLYGIYYKCPCERGLTCNVDKTIVGSITNTNFGVCLDLGRATE